MVCRIYWKRIVVSGLILLFVSNFMYAYNKHSHKDRNNIKNQNNNINNSPIYNHNTENEMISSQINVLKITILRNNYILSSCNKILSHNINYQKSILYKRIKFANLSIDAEINILNNMENIINIHPFNYLEKFQENNYYMSEISPIANQNKFVPASSINISNSRIKSTSPCLNSILYNSEEVFAGIKSICSVMSGTRLLIFSKDNFINNNIYYFSKHLNILTTYNKYANTKNYDDKNQIISKNKFVKIFKSKNKNIYMYSSSDLSNKNSSHNNYINKKVYISFSALLPVAGIIIVILGKVKVFNKRKSYNPMKSFTKSSSEKRELVSMDNIRAIRIFPSTRVIHLQKDIKNKTHDSENSENDSENSEYVSENSEYVSDNSEYVLDNNEYDLYNNVEEPYNSDGIGYKVDNPDDISDLNSSHLKNVEHMDSESTPVDGNILLPLVREINSTLVAENNTMMESVVSTTNSGDTGAYQQVLLEDDIQPRHYSYRIKHTDYLYEDKLLGSLGKGEREIYDNNKKITLMNYWLKYNDDPQLRFYKSLYLKRVITRYTNNTTFNAKVDSFLCQKKLSSLQEWRRPNSRLIFSNVRTRIKLLNNHTLSELNRNEAIATLSQVAEFKLREEVRSKQTNLTKNGWFIKPYYTLNKSFTSNNITSEEYEYLKVVNKQFDNMDLLLSQCTNSGDFFKILVSQIDKKTIPPEINPEMTQLDRYIANEIMLDLGELIKMYKSYMVISHINPSLLKESVPKRIIIPKYIERFQKSRVVKTVYDGPRVFGTTENKIFEILDKFA